MDKQIKDIAFFISFSIKQYMNEKELIKIKLLASSQNITF